MLDETFMALALGLALVTALAAGPEMMTNAEATRIVSMADLPAAASPAARTDAPGPIVWAAEP